MSISQEGQTLPIPPASLAAAGPVTSFDLAMMRLAIDQAHNAATVGEVPVGAVIVRDQRVIATGYNHPIGSHDPTAHAEVRAIRAAGALLGKYRLSDCALYVTLEPCAMCCGAIIHSRMRRLFYGAPDPKTGACGSVIDLMAERRLNHHAAVTGGLLAEECGTLLSDFFAARRRAGRASRDPAPDHGSSPGIAVEFLDDHDGADAASDGG